MILIVQNFHPCSASIRVCDDPRVTLADTTFPPMGNATRCHNTRAPIISKNWQASNFNCNYICTGTARRPLQYDVFSQSPLPWMTQFFWCIFKKLDFMKKGLSFKDSVKKYQQYPKKIKSCMNLNSKPRQQFERGK